MALNPWKASNDVFELIDKIKIKHHERLANVEIAAAFNDSKPFLRNKLNLGKVLKFSPLMKLWQIDKYDLCVIIPMELWSTILKPNQYEPYLDLQLSRFAVEFLPEEVVVNGKKEKARDEWGRIQYSKTVKTDDEGNIKFKILPLDLEVLTQNVRRYGLWCSEFMEFKEAIISTPEGQK